MHSQDDSKHADALGGLFPGSVKIEPPCSTAPQPIHIPGIEKKPAQPVAPAENDEDETDPDADILEASTDTIEQALDPAAAAGGDDASVRLGNSTRVAGSS